MSKTFKIISGALAISLACGAVQLAFGHDLTGRLTPSAVPESGINRTAKADRAGVKPTNAPTQTVALRFNGLPDTSVLVRMPLVKAAAREEARERPAAPMLKSGGQKSAVACEPMVSVLTDVAKLLQPGRCVT